MSCRHKYIRTWVFEDTKEPSGLWSCVDCGLKFEPITQRTFVGLTDDEVEIIYNAVDGNEFPMDFYKEIEAKLKQKNGYAEEKNT